MFRNNEKEYGYWFSRENIQKIEEMKNAKYMGFWCTKNPNGGWNESPVDVFYVENPDTSKGHSHYFGMFYRYDNPLDPNSRKTLMITKGDSAFSEPITGIRTPNGFIIVSRYRHDYVMHDGCVIDGGRDYTRHSGNGTFVEITVDGPNFVIKDKVNA